MTDILLIGPEGQLGFELKAALDTLGTVVTAGRTGADQPLDIADPHAIEEAVSTHQPDLIVNAAAYTAVDAAEKDTAQAYLINAEAPGRIGDAARAIDALVVHFSTDYVFDGTSLHPYSENAIPNPRNVYGSSKLAGEQNLERSGARSLIFRTSWVYGWRRQNFLRTMLRLGAEQEEIRVVDDQIGVPNWCGWLAGTTVEAARRALTNVEGNCWEGLYHLSASGETSWHSFAEHIFTHTRDRFGLKVKRVVPIPTSEYPTPAYRPGYSVLATDKLSRRLQLPPPTWEDLLRDCLTDPQTSA